METHKFGKVLISGGAGFVGSNLVDRLLKDGHQVTVYDNFSTGSIKFLSNAKKYNKLITEEDSSYKLYIIEGDLLDTEKLTKSMQGCDFVFHLAANADVRHGTEHPDKDLKQNTIATYNVLEAMRINNIKKIAFSSTGSIYGEPKIFPTPENAEFPIQTSLYGASKLACEGLIEAYCEGFNFQAWIFRFVSILGEHYSHGHIKDFTQQLVNDPTKLNILGDGTQTKSYLHVKDCINGILCAVKNSNEKINIFNLGTDEVISVNDSIKIICNKLNVSPKLVYSGGTRGWTGDSPFILLDCSKIKRLGWKSTHTIENSIDETLNYLIKNKWLLESE